MGQTIRFIPEAKKQLKTIVKIVGEKTNNKIINRVLVHYPRLINERDSYMQKADHFLAKYEELKDLLKREKELRKSIDKLIEETKQERNQLKIK